MSRNHQGHRGITADIGDNLLPSLTVFGCSLTAVEVHSLMLSSHLFFCLPLYRFPGTVPCTIFLQRPLNLITCPNHRNFLFLTVVNLCKYRWLFVLYCTLFPWRCGLCMKCAKGTLTLTSCELYLMMLQGE